jgi:hypothetical protein
MRKVKFRTLHSLLSEMAPLQPPRPTNQERLSTSSRQVTMPCSGDTDQERGLVGGD